MISFIEPRRIALSFLEVAWVCFLLVIVIAVQVYLKIPGQSAWVCILGYHMGFLGSFRRWRDTTFPGEMRQHSAVAASSCLVQNTGVIEVLFPCRYKIALILLQ